MSLVGPRPERPELQKEIEKEVPEFGLRLQAKAGLTGYEKEPIQQKWNGIAQHVAAVVIGGTDTVVLTLFSTLQNVSI